MEKPIFSRVKWDHLFLVIISIMGLSTGAFAQDHGFVYVENGRLCHPDGKEVALWGVNLQPCISWESGLLKNAGVKKDLEVYKNMVDGALDELEIMKCKVLRCHLTPADFTDEKGNLVETIYLDMLDYMIAEAPKHGMYTYITFLNHMGQGEVPESFMFEVIGKSRIYGENSGRSDIWLYRQANLMFDEESLTCAKNYIRKLLTRTNPYNGLKYLEDPTNILWEVMNEPQYMDYEQMKAAEYHHQQYLSWLSDQNLEDENGKHYARYRKERVLTYLNDMHEFIRNAGAQQPVSWGCNWHRMIVGHEDVFEAIAESKVEAISICNYPGQDEAQKNAGGDNYWDSSLDLTGHDFSDWFKQGYTNRDWYGWMLESRFSRKAKLAYEFETFYNQSAYLYPVQAEFLRAIGVQVTAMWHYSFSEYAQYRSGSHVLNLQCTPRKAASFAVASGIFEDTPLLQAYDVNATTEKVTDKFMFSYEKDLSIFSSDGSYFYSGNVSGKERPKPPEVVKEIVGQGSSPLVSYSGNGLYSADISERQIEIFIAPDYDWVKPPWQRGEGLVTSLDESVTHSFELKMKGLRVSQGELFRIEDGERIPEQLKDGLLKFNAQPGKYVIVLPPVEKGPAPGEQSLFKVSKATETITIDGKMDERSWDRTEVRSFDFFYDAEAPDEKQQTNLLKTASDFVYFNNYYEGKDKILRSFDMDYKAGLAYDGTLNDNSDEDKGWTMEIAIPVRMFAELPDFSQIQAGSRWAFQAARQDRNSLNSNHRFKSTIFPIFDLMKGGFHQPGRFGLKEFVE